MGNSQGAPTMGGGEYVDPSQVNSYIQDALQPNLVQGALGQNNPYSQLSSQQLSSLSNALQGNYNATDALEAAINAPSAQQYETNPQQAYEYEASLPQYATAYQDYQTAQNAINSIENPNNTAFGNNNGAYSNLSSILDAPDIANPEAGQGQSLGQALLTGAGLFLAPVGGALGALGSLAGGATAAPSILSGIGALANTFLGSGVLSPTASGVPQTNGIDSPLTNISAPGGSVGGSPVSGITGNAFNI